MKIHSGERVLVSACLLGICCRYNGISHADDRILALTSSCVLIPVCPEQLGGLPTPREAAEIVRHRVLTRTGNDVTPAFLHGAQQGVHIGQLAGCAKAVLQPRSPSCGVRQIYDGTFSGRLISGQGFFARALLQAGIQVFEPEDLS